MQAIDTAFNRLVGKAIHLNRGSSGRPTGKGRDRLVRARLDRIEGNMVFATLLEDDPDAGSAPYKAGEEGCWHGLSFIAGRAPSEDLSELAYEILRVAVNLGRYENVRTVAALRKRLNERYPGHDDDVADALHFWAQNTRERHPNGPN